MTRLTALKYEILFRALTDHVPKPGDPGDLFVADLDSSEPPALRLGRHPIWLRQYSMP